MRFHEIESGVRLPVSQEEQEVLDIVNKNGFSTADNFDDRQNEVARLMVSRGLLLRRRKDGQQVYLPNSINDLWRL